MINYFLLFLFFKISFQKSDVYFTKEISPSSMVKMFKMLNINLTGNIGLKVHSGELLGKYFLTPDFLQEIYDYTNGTFIECNTAYKSGVRHTTATHKILLKDHGWLNNSRRFVLMDEDPLQDFNLTVLNHEMISENIVVGHLKEFDSCIVLSHFKGHGTGGYGGALKQLSIGFASQRGKTFIHTAGKFTDYTVMSENKANQINFTAAMGDAASTIVNYFKNKGKIAYINVMANISLRCDCAGGNAPAPKIHDMGILASLDPVALDKACLDIIKSHVDKGTDEWLKQLEDKKGENTIFVSEQHGIGSQEYILVDLDETSSGNDGLNNSTLIIIIAVVVFILLLIFIGGLIFYKRRNKSSDENLDEVLNENESGENKQN